MLALVIYEYIITSGAEKQLFWGRKFAAPAALFFANRYLNLINWLYQFCLVFNVGVTIEVRRARRCLGRIWH